MNKIIFTLSFIILGLSVYSQTETPPAIITDRPDQTESATTLPSRTLQLETGAAFIFNKTATEEQKDMIYNTTLLRVAVFKNFELRFGFEYHELTVTDLQTNEETLKEGLSPISLGLKVHITDEKGWIPEMGFLGHVEIGTSGDVEFQIPFTGPSFRLAFANTISDHVSIGYNIGADWDGETARAAWYYSVAPGFSIGERWGCFIEAYGYIVEKSTPVHMADGGITFLVINNLQLDVSAGFGINEQAPDGFVSGGLSWRIPQ